MARIDKTETKGGKVYNYRYYRYGEYVAFDENRIPTTGQNKDSWGYARNNYKDHFAESYMKATLVPEQYAKDLLDTPAIVVNDGSGSIAKAELIVWNHSAIEQWRVSLPSMLKPINRLDSHWVAASDNDVAVGTMNDIAVYDIATGKQLLV